MARIEELIKDVPDQRLREAIAEEVRKLKKETKFGLVFEEHLPETIQLPSLPIKRGARVVKRGDNEQAPFLVREVFQNGRMRIAPERGGEEETVARKELVVIKRVGEPIYPTLIPVDRVTRAPEKPYHTIINADNYHALQLLLYCYEGQVDVIYIDPPYNTGARDWKYNNNFVDSADQWRHSKWLSMMRRRLLLAERLLKPDGVLVIAIDDNEIHHLACLLSALFPSKSVSTVTVVHNPRGNITANFSQIHEYAVFLIDKGVSRILRTTRTNTSPRKLRRWGHNSTRTARPTMFYPIYVRENAITRIGSIPDNSFHPQGKNVFTQSGEIEVWPIDQNGVERRWNFSIDTVNDQLDRIVVVRDHNGVDLFLSEEDTVPKTVWSAPELDSGGKWGSKLVEAIVGDKFPFPKSVYSVFRCLEVTSRETPNALVLDFFAGSGTTFHATLMMNNQYGGQRRCILVTNNETEEKVAKDLLLNGIREDEKEYEQRGICEAITWPRVKNTIRGQKADGSIIGNENLCSSELTPGFSENAEYFKLAFLGRDEVSRGEQFESILPILWLMAGGKGERETARGYSKWFIPKESPFAVLIKEDHFDAFKAELDKRSDITHVFLVTDPLSAFRDMSADVDGNRRCIQLYKSYLDNFRINLENRP